MKCRYYINYSLIFRQFKNNNKKLKIQLDILGKVKYNKDNKRNKETKKQRNKETKKEIKKKSKRNEEKTSQTGGQSNGIMNLYFKKISKRVYIE